MRKKTPDRNRASRPGKNVVRGHPSNEGGKKGEGAPPGKESKKGREFITKTACPSTQAHSGRRRRGGDRTCTRKK